MTTVALQNTLDEGFRDLESPKCFLDGPMLDGVKGLAEIDVQRNARLTPNGSRLRQEGKSHGMFGGPSVRPETVLFCTQVRVQDPQSVKE